MNNRYNRNRIYVTEENQEQLKRYNLLIAGCGIGSVIAECALRMGFEKMTIIDGDIVEETNLNRQNYIKSNINNSKVVSLYNRLKSINKEAEITYQNTFITKENINEIIENHDVAINCLDFDSEIPLLFDKICQENKIPVLHPYNLGFASLVTIISPEGKSLEFLKKENEKFNELKVVEYVTSYMTFWGDQQLWLEKVIKDYKSEEGNISPPQLAIASWILGGMCTHILYNIATGKPYKQFPEFYFSSINN